jgi:hypothetical protein
MIRSNNDMTNRQRFSIKVVQQSDGRYRASCKDDNVKVEPVIANSVSIATAMLDDRLQKLNSEGKLG